MSENSEFKEITVNSNYLKVSEEPSKSVSKLSTKKKAMPMSASRIKAELLEQLREKRMKDYMRIVEKRASNKKNDEIKEYLKDGYGSSLDYLNDAIRRHREKRIRRSLKKTAKFKRLSIGGNVSENGPSLKDTSSISLETKCQRIDPPYGCLKGGTKPTFRQYNRTLKKGVPREDNSVMLRTPSITLSQHVERKLPKKKFINCLKRRKMTIKAGKSNDRKGKMGIFMKNQDIRRKTQKKIDVIKGTTTAQMRGYLRERGLIKVGTYAPDDIIREIYMSSCMAGDITNKNGDVLKHNFFNPDVLSETKTNNTIQYDDSDDEPENSSVHKVIVS